jgi:anti-anti-sigma factor
MSIEQWSDNAVLVEMPSEPEVGAELESVIRYVRDRGDCSVVLDFSDVTILTSTSLASLLRLKKMLDGCQRRLVMCSVGSGTRGIISVTGLDDLFEMVADRFDALATVQASPDDKAVSAEDVS